MKLHLVFTALLVSGAVAILASSERLAARLERRRGGRQSKPLNRIESSLKAVSNDNEIQYSPNWAGAVLNEAPGTWKSVTGTFTVPTPKPASGQTFGSAAAWVGIDGDTCSNAILQTGVDFTVSESGVSYDAWYEWYPDFASDFSNIPISAGDVMTVSVNASSTTAGKVVITNETTGKAVSKSLTSSSALCQQDAEWIVEDYEEGFKLVTFANFGTVTFSNAEATTNSGANNGPSDATIFDIQQRNDVLTSVSTSSSGVVVSYN